MQDFGYILAQNGDSFRISFYRAHVTHKLSHQHTNSSQRCLPLPNVGKAKQFTAAFRNAMKKHFARKHGSQKVIFGGPVGVQVLNFGTKPTKESSVTPTKPPTKRPTPTDPQNTAPGKQSRTESTDPPTDSKAESVEFSTDKKVSSYSLSQGKTLYFWNESKQCHEQLKQAQDLTQSLIP